MVVDDKGGWCLVTVRVVDRGYGDGRGGRLSTKWYLIILHFIQCFNDLDQFRTNKCLNLNVNKCI